jgi:hypothetical protein
MRFVISYINHPRMRGLIETFISRMVEHGYDFSQTTFQSQILQIMPVWPVGDIPLNVQCEEVEFKNGKLESLRVLVIDV